MPNSSHKRSRVPFVFAAAALCALLPVTAAVAAKGANRPNGGGSYSVTVSPAGPYTFGEEVTVATNTPATNSGPWIALACYQNGKVVYGETHAGFAAGWYYNTPFHLGPSLSWTSGAADCTVTVSHQSNNKSITDASTTLHVNA
jgi:hypothetical protein